MTNNINQTLHKLIVKLIKLLELELNILSLQKNDNNIIATKNITETLNKLIILITQLNKLSSIQSLSNSTKIDEKDKIIIDNFLKNYQIKNFCS